jgi:hypothetical protein
MCRDCRYPPKSCAHPGCNKQGHSLGLCKAHYNRKRRADNGWLAEAGSDPEKRRQKDRMKTRRRRAQVHDPLAEDIYIDVVGERDGWRCGVPECRRRPIDRTKRHPHPLSPSIDHIEPLSRGGLHTYANVRIAHLRCNIARSNRFTYEQLALVG